MNQLPIMGLMIVAAFLGSIGQIALRKASDKLVLTFPALATNWWLYLFILTYGLAVIINIVGYKLGGRVAIIYPVIALSYIFSALLAWKYLGEQVNGWIILGSVTIILGVALIGYGGKFYV